LLKAVLPQPTEWLQHNFRLLYRLIKMVRLLAEADWRCALLRSLDFEPKNYPVYYAKLVAILEAFERKSGDRHKSIMMFFLLILQSREMQKYQLLPDGFKVLLPFMDRRFIERCYLTPTHLFMRHGKRKVPILKRVRAVFPELFSSAKTTPFAVQYQINYRQSGGGRQAKAGTYTQLKEYCIDALSKTLGKPAL
jgi:hypothetical protein